MRGLAQTGVSVLRCCATVPHGRLDFGCLRGMVGGMMKTADMPDTAIPEFVELTEGDWARLEAKYRSKYKKEAAAYREKFGEEPSLGTLVGAEIRTECNNSTEEEDDHDLAYAMRVIHSEAAEKRHAGRHAARG